MEMSPNKTNQADTFFVRAEPPPIYLIPLSKIERGNHEKESLNRSKD